MFGKITVFFLRSIPYVLAALILFSIFHYSVDVPFWDEWGTPGELFDKIVTGDLSPADLFSQHNESRKVIPKIIFLLVGSILGWRVSVFMVLSWAIVLLTLIMLRHILFPDKRPAGPAGYLVVSLFSIFLFSPGQYVNFLWGIQFIVFVPALCIAGCLWTRVSKFEYGTKNLLRVVLCYVATFTYSNGMLCWVLGADVDLRGIFTGGPQTPDTPPNRKLHDIFYISSGVIALTVYFIDHSLPGFTAPVRNMTEALRFFTVWIGAPYINSGSVYSRIPIASISGLSLIILGVSAFSLYRSMVSRHREKSFLMDGWPWISLALYGILSGVMVTLGRSGSGTIAALAPRYVTFQIWAPMGIAGLIYVIYTTAEPLGCPGRKKVCIISFLVLVVFGGTTWSNGFYRFEMTNREQKQNLLSLRMIRVAPRNPLLKKIHPGDITGRVERLSAWPGLLKIDFLGDWIMEGVRDPYGEAVGHFNVSKPGDGEIKFYGWAMLPDNKTPPDYVVICHRAHTGKISVVTAILCDRKRQDVVDFMNNPDLLYSGFQKFLQLEEENGEGNYFGVAVDEKDQKVYTLGRHRNDPL